MEKFLSGLVGGVLMAAVMAVVGCFTPTPGMMIVSLQIIVVGVVVLVAVAFITTAVEVAETHEKSITLRETRGTWKCECGRCPECLDTMIEKAGAKDQRCADLIGGMFFDGLLSEEEYIRQVRLFAGGYNDTILDGTSIDIWNDF